MNNKLTVSSLLATLLLGACATTQQPPPDLVEARSTVRSAELDPAVVLNAPNELKKATTSLNRANTLLSQGESPVAVSSAAYLASQQAKTAMAIAKAKSSETALGSAEVERERARADMRTAEAQRARAQASAANQQTAVAIQQTAVAEQQAAAAQANASQAQMQSAQLQEQLNALQAKQTDRGMLVTLGDVLFETGSANVKPGAQASLRKLADFLQKNPNRRILIEGHTDSVGAASYNEALSRKRADAVSSALQGMGVATPRVSTVGYGESYPVADNATDTNRALNRRVEVYIGENDQPVKSRS